jgi:hypothetical protein
MHQFSVKVYLWYIDVDIGVDTIMEGVSMLKKLLVASAIFGGCLSSVFAGLYLGPSLSYDSIWVGNTRYQGISPRITLGFGHDFGEWVYGAVEIFATRSFQLHNNPNIASLRVTWVYGASILPGIQLDPVLAAFARLGIVNADFVNIGTDRTGYQAGLGLQAKLSPSWTIRAEYDYTHYRVLDAIGGNPNESQYVAGFLYDFNFC